MLENEKIPMCVASSFLSETFGRLGYHDKDSKSFTRRYVVWMRPTNLKAQTCMGPRHDILEFHTIPVVEDMRRHLNYYSGTSPYYTSLWNYLTRIHDTFKGNTVKLLASGQRVSRVEMRPLVSIDSSLRRLGHQPADSVLLEISDQMVAVWKAATRQPILKKQDVEKGLGKTRKSVDVDKISGAVACTLRNETWQSRERKRVRRKDIVSARPTRPSFIFMSRVFRFCCISGIFVLGCQLQACNTLQMRLGGSDKCSSRRYAQI
jgi:hypothetical protein